MDLKIHIILMVSCAIPNGNVKNYLKNMGKKLNPFKLWGSYAGAVIYTIIIPFILTKLNIQSSILAKIIYFPFFIIFRFVPCNDWGCLGLFFGIFIILAPIIGFFVGYWIHRFFKK